jgi:hypothetical protein
MSMSTHVKTPAGRAKGRTVRRDNSSVWGLCYYNTIYKWEGGITYTEWVPAYFHHTISVRLIWKVDA